MYEVRIARSLLRRVALGLPAIALVGVGGALAATNGTTDIASVAESRPIIDVPDLAAIQDGLARLEALPPLPALPAERADEAAGVTVVRSPAAAPVTALSSNGIPQRALQAYRGAATLLASADPSCRIDWALIAGIGKVESNHGRYGGNGIDTDGTVKPGIIGIALDGTNNTARITDTDGGLLDLDPVYDRAVGPMQFIPSTWANLGVDANNDGVKDPHNIDDAAAATAAYLCSGSADLTEPTALFAAVKRYNHSDDYARTVIGIAASYRAGFSVVPPQGLTPAQASGAPAVPVVTAGPVTPAPAAAAPVAPPVAAAPTVPPVVAPPVVKPKPTKPPVTVPPVTTTPPIGTPPTTTPPDPGTEEPPGDGEPGTDPGTEEPPGEGEPGTEEPPGEGTCEDADSGTQDPGTDGSTATDPPTEDGACPGDGDQTPPAGGDDQTPGGDAGQDQPDATREDQGDATS